MMDTARKNDKAEMARARANVYSLLAHVFRAEPSEDFLSNLKGPEFSDALEALGTSPLGVFQNTPPGRLAEDLAIEFSKLFIGPGPRLSPHESLHVENGCGGNEYWGEGTVRVKKFMAAAGLEVADEFSGMPDHISAELEFMQLLAEQEATYWTDDNIEAAGNITLVQQRFFDEHLSQWVPQFCDKIVDQAELPFFKEMAELTKGFVAFEQDIFTAQETARNGG